MHTNLQQLKFFKYTVKNPKGIYNNYNKRKKAKIINLRNI